MVSFSIFKVLTYVFFQIDMNKHSKVRTKIASQQIKRLLKLIALRLNANRVANEHMLF